MSLNRLLGIELIMLAVSVCATFAVAVFAYLMQGTPAPAVNALAVSATGGFAGEAIEAPFIWGVRLFCTCYALAGIGLLITLAFFVIRTLIRLLHTVRVG